MANIKNIFTGKVHILKFIKLISKIYQIEACKSQTARVKHMKTGIICHCWKLLLPWQSTDTSIWKRYIMPIFFLAQDQINFI